MLLFLHNHNVICGALLLYCTGMVCTADEVRRGSSLHFFKATDALAEGLHTKFFL